MKGIDVLKYGIATHFVPQEKIGTFKKELRGNFSEKTTKKDIMEIVNTYAKNERGEEPVDNLQEIEDIF